jgi:hypothetical protein
MAAVNGAATWEAESVAAAQAPAKDQTAESAMARYVRAVTQPGGMDIDWPRVRATGAVIAGLSAIHGLRYRQWQYVHIFGVALGLVAAAAGLLKNKYVEAPRPAGNN